ncbi:hypothetical protein AB837_00450 [bacterium AB1]|nr:hypothetical protein AB837_00450 [bacterium AB1]
MGNDLEVKKQVIQQQLLKALEKDNLLLNSQKTELTIEEQVLCMFKNVNLDYMIISLRSDALLLNDEILMDESDINENQKCMINVNGEVCYMKMYVFYLYFKRNLNVQNDFMEKKSNIDNIFLHKLNSILTTNKELIKTYSSIESEDVRNCLQNSHNRIMLLNIQNAYQQYRLSLQNLCKNIRDHYLEIAS